MCIICINIICINIYQLALRKGPSHLNSHRKQGRTCQLVYPTFCLDGHRLSHCRLNTLLKTMNKFEHLIIQLKIICISFSLCPLLQCSVGLNFLNKRSFINIINVTPLKRHQYISILSVTYTSFPSSILLDLFFFTDI